MLTVDRSMVELLHFDPHFRLDLAADLSHRPVSCTLHLEAWKCTATLHPHIKDDLPAA